MKERFEAVSTPTRTLVLHGFNVSDKGEETTRKFLPYLRVANTGAGNVETLDYGWFGLWSVMFKNKKVAAQIVKDFQGFAHYAVGHSNGCAIIVEAAKQGAKFKRVLLINPALPIDTIFPPSIEEILVVYTKHDKATKAARWANRIPFISFFAPAAWGAMGTRGATYHKDNVALAIHVEGIADGVPKHVGAFASAIRTDNYNLSEYLSGHSDFFSTDVLQSFGSEYAALLYNGSFM